MFLSDKLKTVGKIQGWIKYLVYVSSGTNFCLTHIGKQTLLNKINEFIGGCATYTWPLCSLDLPLDFEKKFKQGKFSRWTFISIP